MADGRVTEPSQVHRRLELAHDELGDELREPVLRSGDLFFVDDGVGGQAGQGAVSAAPLEEHLHEADGARPGVRRPAACEHPQQELLQ